MGPVPLVSRALSREGAGYRAPQAALPLPEPTSLGRVYAFDRRYGGCGFRAWLEDFEGLRPEDEEGRGWYPAFRRLAAAKADPAGPAAEDLAAFGMSRAVWERLSFYPSVSFEGVKVTVHAGEREGRTAYIHRFGGPVAGREEAREEFKERWAEFIVAEQYLQHGYRVELVYWPFGGAPINAYGADPGQGWFTNMIKTRKERAQRALKRYRQARAEAVPGWHCRSCPFADVCRKDEVEA